VSAPAGDPAEEPSVPAKVGALPAADQAPPADVVIPNNSGVTSGLAMKRRNPIAVWIGLPLITLGIYQLVWYYKIHKEMAEYDRRRAIPVAGPMLVLLFLSWTLIAPIVSYHNAGARIRNAQRAAGLAPSCSSTLSWLLVFAFGLNTLYMQLELNKVIDRYAGAPTSTPVPLYV